jgi:hypothetical protein
MSHVIETPSEESKVSLHYLMSRYAASPALWVAQAIVHQLETITSQMGEGWGNPYLRLLIIWQAIERQHLLTRQSRYPDLDLSREINKHLNWLSEHPQALQYPVLQKTSGRLALYWDTNSDAQEAKRTTPHRKGVH